MLAAGPWKGGHTLRFAIDFDRLFRTADARVFVLSIVAAEVYLQFI